MKRGKNLSQTQYIAVGFFVMILTGALLLTLPAASRSGDSVGFLNALFTAASAGCVTGLVVADTWRQWTLFGHLVILTLIQIGELGFVTIGVFVSILMRRKIGLRTRGRIEESVNALQIGGVVRLTKRIVIGTLLFEGVGACLLALRFVPQFGVVKGLGFSIFHSISAFCNAGFDLMGAETPYASLCAYEADWLVNLVIMGLIMVGGIGFIVWNDLYIKGVRWRSYLLHTKLVLMMTGVLVFGGAVLFYILERDGTFLGMTTSEKVLGALFCSVTPRTAGFNTVDTAALSQGGTLLTMILMLIGGSPGSTAGGVKTTTILVLLMSAWAEIKRTQGVNVFKRRLEADAVRRASVILCINLGLAVTAALVITMLQPLSLTDVMFETLSAIGTVGMSTGITRDLETIPRLVIIFLMYCGRIGSLSFALSFAQKREVVHVKQPAERITIG